MTERKLTEEQLKSNLEKLAKSTPGRAMRQILDQNIEMLDKVTNLQADPDEKNMAALVAGRHYAIHILKVLRKSITEDLAKKDNSDNIKSEYE